MRHAGRRLRSAAGLPAILAAVAPRVSEACDVRYGNADSPWIDAAQASVWLMLGVTAAVQLGFVVFFLKLRSRAKAAAAMRGAMKAVEGKGAA